MATPEDLEVIQVIEATLMKRWPESKIEPSLDRIAALVDALGSPQLSYPTVHIGGTNGKTSTSRMIDALFSELEYRTGRFTSPHLESFLERISIKGEAINPAELIATYNDIALYLDLIDSRSEVPISYFEALTALALIAAKALSIAERKPICLANFSGVDRFFNSIANSSFEIPERPPKNVSSPADT